MRTPELRAVAVYLGSVRRIALLLALGSLIAAPGAFASVKHGNYLATTEPGHHKIELRFGHDAVHDFKMNGHVIIRRLALTATHDGFTGHTAAGREVFGFFKSDGRVVGQIDPAGSHPGYFFHGHFVH